jgi:hypothetical protein
VVGAGGEVLTVDRGAVAVGCEGDSHRVFDMRQSLFAR